MLIIRNSDNIPEIGDSVVAVGSFDGVHLGHCKILNFLKTESERMNCKSVVVTFDPHPRDVLGKDSEFFTINTLDENLDLIGKQGIDMVLIEDFTEEFSKTTYQDFVKNVVLDKLHAKSLVMGPNHSMGHNREGNHGSIKEFCKQNGINVIEIPEEMHLEAGVHSAKIRNLIKEKRWKEVDEMLGYNYNHKEKSKHQYE